jgi:hypothetical protein
VSSSRMDASNVKNNSDKNKIQAVARTASEYYKNIVRMASNASLEIEAAVLPIYFLQKASARLQQVASGVCLRVKDQNFVLSASHVFDDIGKYQLLIGLANGRPIVPFSGERFSTKRGRSGTHADDPVDASVFHVQSEVPAEFGKIALTLDDIDLSQPDRNAHFFNCIGFPSKKSSRTANSINSHRECRVLTEYGKEEYDTLSIDREIHVALAYEEKILVDGSLQTLPRPKGMSGGAIFKIEGVTTSSLLSPPPNPDVLLSAITIAHRPQKAGKPSVLIGTRVGVHLGLIEKYLPGLLDLEKE